MQSDLPQFTAWGKDNPNYNNTHPLNLRHHASAEKVCFQKRLDIPCGVLSLRPSFIFGGGVNKE